jgi:hypothetical protein
MSLLSFLVGWTCDSVVVRRREHVGVHRDHVIVDAGVEALRLGHTGAGAKGDEQRQQVFLGRMRPRGGGRLAAVVEQRIDIAGRETVGDPVGELANIGGRAAALLPGELEIAQIVGDAAGTDDQKPAPGQRREGAAKREVIFLTNLNKKR